MVRAVNVTTALALSLLYADQAQATYGSDKPGSGNNKPGGRPVVQNCVMSDWTPYDACDVTGYKSRNRFVVTWPSKGGSPCPSTMEMAKCAKDEFLMGPWGNWVCNAKTGMKSRTRAVVRQGNTKYYKKPAVKETAVCDPIPCVINSVDEDTRPWSACTKDKKGVWTKSKVLGVKAPAQYGGLCPAGSDPVRKATKACPPVNCELYTKDTDPGSWNACSKDTDNKYYESKVLGMSVQPLYGGKACPAVTEPSRIAKNECPAVNCVVRTEAQETENKWDGDCVKDALSNSWYEHKKLGIATLDKYGGTVCPAEGTPERTAERLCDPINCVVRAEADEVVEMWDGNCVKDTVSGKWFEHKKLGIDTESKYGGTTCPLEGSPERTASRECLPIDCLVKTDAQEQDNSWDDTCVEDTVRGKWYEHKKLGIAREAKYGGVDCDAEGSASRTAERECTPVNCVVRTVEQETVNDWDGTCVEDTDGFWYEHKKLGIHTEAANGGTECDSEGSASRTAKRKCDPVDCIVNTESEDTGAWDDNCVVDSVSGKYFEHKVLGIKRADKWGGVACPAPTDSSIIASRECPAVECLVRTEAEETGAQWDGVCVEDTSDGVWYQHKKLGIAREPKFGGADCPLEGSPERTAKKVCPAVDCVVRAEADETTATWDGNCVKDDVRGQWFEHKKLGIAVEAANGGTACPAEGSAARTAERLCPPVDCVVNTEAEDEGAFDDECVQDTDGWWYEHKVLGIKSVAQYGGNDCASETDASRIVKRQCAPVDCVVNSPDSGTYGTCAEGTWKNAYKIKLIGISEPALYGGDACPTPIERTVADFCTISEYFSALTMSISASSTQLKKVNSVLTAKSGSIDFGTLQPINAAAPNKLEFSGIACSGTKMRKLTVTVTCGTEIALTRAVQAGECDWTSTLAMPVKEVCSGKPTNA